MKKLKFAQILCNEIERRFIMTGSQENDRRDRAAFGSDGPM
jgi:hypothetical protein